MDKKEDYLGILLDIQKQLWANTTETRWQTELLKALNDKVAIQNWRIYKTEGKVLGIELLLNNWKGRLAIIAIIVTFIWSFAKDIIKYIFKIEF